AIAASIAARCEMDLSPGSFIFPRMELAEEIFIFSILDDARAVCLDSNYPKSVTYKEYTVSDTKELSLASRIESVDEAAEAAAQFARHAGLGDEARFAVDLAVRESVANAVKHGNKFDAGKQV